MLLVFVTVICILRGGEFRMGMLWILHMLYVVIVFILRSSGDSDMKYQPAFSVE